jgi:iron complex outermembrane receptor protein
LERIKSKQPPGSSQQTSFKCIYIRLMRLLSSFLILFSSWAVHSQSITVKGTISDASTGEPLFGIMVGDTITGKGTTSDFEGKFALEVTTPCVLRCSGLGYATLYYNVTAIERIEIKMVLQDQSLEEVEIVSDRILERQKRSPLSVEGMDAKAIRLAPSGNFYESLSNMKGVDMASASLAFRIINTRGFNSTSPVRILQLIDGVDNQSPGLNFSLGNFLGAPDLDIKNVDVIQGATSAYFGPGAFNGVIHMETKDPFFTPGLSATVKAGERNLAEVSARWADVFKNEHNEEVFAYKININYLTANDWQAANTQPIYNSSNDINNPGRFDAVNIYGDEYFGGFDYSTVAPWSESYRGLGTYYRTGYRESDLVDYRTENLKASFAAHWRLQPAQGANSAEIIVQNNFGTGTTVFQGDNRFRLKDIFFMQQKIELRKKDQFFIRLYTTSENAGKSYDPYFTALRLQEEARDNETWMSVYNRYWAERVVPRMKALGYPGIEFNPEWPANSDNPFLPYDTQGQQQWMNLYHDSLISWHSWVEQLTNTGNAGIQGVNPLGHFVPGSSDFKENFTRITQAKNNDAEAGTRFYDRSSLYNGQAEKIFRSRILDEIRFGVSARLYNPVTDGTIFIDTLKPEITRDGDTIFTRDKIFNFQYGFYAGVSRKFLDDKLSLEATLRADKNINFDWVYSPALSAVYKMRQSDYFRLTLTSALRNPTMADQYLNLNVGPATLRGNLSGETDLITLASFRQWRDSQRRSDLRYFDINPIRPEQAQSLELGYRATVGKKLFIDFGCYATQYQHFIGYKIGLKAEFDEFDLPIYSSIKAYRFAANASQKVWTTGFQSGINYYYYKNHLVQFNYSFNRIITDDSDEIIPAFNTPEHKTNVGISGNELKTAHTQITWGYGVNYKWVDFYMWEGSPQFTGPVPAFHIIDLQFHMNLLKYHLTLKAGASNALNNLHIEAYGGPAIGRLGYIQIIYQWDKK